MMKPGRFYWLPQPFLLAGSRTTTAARGQGHGVCGARARSRGRASRATIHPVLNQTEPVEANEMASPPGAGCSPFEHACDLTLVQRRPVQV